MTKRYFEEKARKEITELHDDLFGDWDVMSLYAQKMLKNDPRDFMHTAGFAERPKPGSEIRQINPGHQARVQEFFHGRPTLPFLALQDDAHVGKPTPPTGLILPFQNTKEDTRDVVYAGIVDLDDIDYSVEFIDEPEKSPGRIFDFHGKQSDIDLDTWASVLKNGHKTLIMRPTYGVA